MKSGLQALVLGVVVVIAMIAGGLLAVAIAGNDDSTSAPTSAGSEVTAPAASGGASQNDSSVSLTAIDDLPTLVDRVSSSVVAISTVSGTGTRQATGLGTGVVIDKDGHILTNNHVIDGARQVSVEFKDGTVIPGTVIGTDPGNDLAVVRVNLSGDQLKPAKLGDSDKVRPGESVFAIGNPFSEKFSVTSGIISATDRDSTGNTSTGRPVRGMLQTDAAVNPGNSGGPLFDDAGRVIGINSQIYSRSGGYQGLAFAIPIDVALQVKDQIVATGHAQHARLGVTVQDLTQPLADSFGLKRPDGALISSVAPESAAAKAGLKSGDVVTAVDGEPVVRSGELSSRIGMSMPGEQVKLTVWRDKEPREIKATLGKIEPEGKQVAAAAVEPGKLGLALRPLTPEEKRESHIEQGMVVQNAAGPAARAGIRSGDVLLSINGKPTGSMDEIRSVLESKPKNVALLVQRDGNRLFVPVNLG